MAEFDRPGNNMFNVPQSLLGSFDDLLPLLPRLDIPTAINLVQLLQQPVELVLILAHRLVGACIWDQLGEVA